MQIKYVVIGAAGHHHQVTDAVMRGLVNMPAAIAPGIESEDMSSLSGKIGVPLYEDWRVMLDEIRPEVVVVNSILGVNDQITCECLEKGMHVYSEKPLACTLEGLEYLKTVWEKSGLDLGCMLNLNCCGWYQAVEKAINDGEIGEVRLVHGQKSYRLGTRPAFYSSRETYGGTIPWIGIHAVDWVLRLGGKCEWVSAVHSSYANGGNGDMESSSAILLQLENGVIGTVDADYFRPIGSARHDDDRLRVTGTRGMVEAINGRVWLENEEKRRELEVPEDINPFVRFVNGIGTEGNRVLAEQALEDTRICLFARTAADAKMAVRV